MEKELMFHGMEVKDGGIDMKLSGEPAMLFMGTLIEFFKQNGGKNFLTLTINDKENKYAITIQNCNGEDTPSEKLERLENEKGDLEGKSQAILSDLKYNMKLNREKDACIRDLIQELEKTRTAIQNGLNYGYIHKCECSSKWLERVESTLEKAKGVEGNE